MVKLEAIQLRSGTWVVRPEGQLGTCGFYPRPWMAYFTKARNAQEAIRKAKIHCSDYKEKSC